MNRVSSAQQASLKRLFLALKHGAFLDSIKRFIDDIDDINATYGSSGGNALHFAIRQKCELEIIEELINRGVNINARDNASMTPLHFAVESDKSDEYVPKLLALGADVNARNELGETSLLMAIGPFKSLEVIKLLLEYGADTEETYNIYVPHCRFNIVQAAILSGGFQCSKVFIKIIMLKHYEKNVSILIKLRKSINRINRPVVSEFIDECFVELALMKTIKINSTYSAINFALCGRNRCSKPLYANVDLAEPHLSFLFPIYSDVIQDNIALGFQRGQRIKNLQDLQTCLISKGYDSEGREKVVILIYDCIEMICSYLSNLELESFSQAFHV